jgi:hypothetical protein
MNSQNKKHKPNRQNHKKPKRHLKLLINHKKLKLMKISKKRQLNRLLLTKQQMLRLNKINNNKKQLRSNKLNKINKIHRNNRKRSRQIPGTKELSHQLIKEPQMLVNLLSRNILNFIPQHQSQ